MRPHIQLVSSRRASTEEEEEEVANAAVSWPAPQTAVLAWPSCGKVLSPHHSKLHHQLIGIVLARGSISTPWWNTAPFNFWVSKLSTWPELALYALEILACPAASVLSELVFSTAGSVITDKRSRLSTANVDKLMFIKMNQTWIPQDLSVPCAN